MASWTVYVNGVATFAGYPETDQQTLEAVSEWVSTQGSRVVWRLPGYTIEWKPNDPVSLAIATTNYAQFMYGTKAVVELESQGMTMPTSPRRLPSDVF